MWELLIFLGLLALGYFAGTFQERQHFQRLQMREAEMQRLPVYNLSACELVPPAQSSTLVTGSVVVSGDYFKAVAASLISLVGGRISVYETLVERGRREALVRMKAEAIAWGASQVLNVRIETSSLNAESGGGLVAIEVIAYGTGVR
jgi:uncharacterized protein YbjQ (UPF0145 family)